MALLREILPSISQQRYDIINEATRNSAGAPDLSIFRRDTDGDGIAIGYVETKDIGINLDKEEKSEQLQRYRNGLENLILTDYLEFRFFINGEKN